MLLGVVHNRLQPTISRLSSTPYIFHCRPLRERTITAHSNKAQPKWKDKPKSNQDRTLRSVRSPPRTTKPNGILRQTSPKFSPSPNLAHHPLEPSHHALPSASTPSSSSTVPVEATRTRWEPTKKLTYAAMSALRVLHETDPIKYDKADLSQRFGISYEAVGRILKSKWRGKES